MLNETVTKLLQTAKDTNTFGTTLTITGAGGYGKTTIVKSLCYHPTIKKRFSNGFLFIELGPRPPDTNSKLKEIYELLANKICNTGLVEDKIKLLTGEYYHNLLVVIDDVWNAEDAKPFVKVFSNCKTILITRKNNITKFIPSGQSVAVGPMKQDEAVSVLCNELTDYSKLSQENKTLLDKIAQNAHLWPLLLYLIRNELSCNLEQSSLPYGKAIQNIKAKLRHEGLTAFDKSDSESMVKICIEVTLVSLTKASLDKIKTMILYSGISALPSNVLKNLWNISKQDAQDAINKLWATGVVRFIDIQIPLGNLKQQCIEVHPVISQYVIENMDSNDFKNLSPYYSEHLNARTQQSVRRELLNDFMQAYGVTNTLELSSIDLFKYQMSEIDAVDLPYFLRGINMYVVSDPHLITEQLKMIQHKITPQYSAKFDKEINSLLADCEHMLKIAYNLCRKLNQNVERYLINNDYSNIIPYIQKFIKKYPLCNIIFKAITMVDNIISCCDVGLKKPLMMIKQNLYLFARDYHEITTRILPSLELFINVHKRCHISLTTRVGFGETLHYLLFGKFDEDCRLIEKNRLIKLQEVAPHFVHQKRQHQDTSRRFKLTPLNRTGTSKYLM